MRQFYLQPVDFLLPVLHRKISHELRKRYQTTHKQPISTEKRSSEVNEIMPFNNYRSPTFRTGKDEDSNYSFFKRRTVQPSYYDNDKVFERKVKRVEAISCFHITHKTCT
uniref:Uncharacterized protein n=1 Tax=Parascaris equorum TaxID=6256 RepID=A0A914S395_PAREQ